MKNQIWLTAGIAGMLLGSPFAIAQAKTDVYFSTESRPSFVIDSPPRLIYMKTQGFSVSVGSRYDMIFYGNRYYLFNDGRWYSSLRYRGPWTLMNSNHLPLKLRRYSWNEISRYRDIEYRRLESYDKDYQRNDDNKSRYMDERSDERGRRRYEEQPNTHTEFIPNHREQSTQSFEIRSHQGRQNEAPDNKPNRGEQSRGQDNKPSHGQLNNPAENRPNQGQPNKPSDSRPNQSQPNKPADNRPSQGQPSKPSDNRPGQGQPNKPADSKPAQGMQSKPADNKPQGQGKASDSKKQDGAQKRDEKNK